MDYKLRKRKFNKQTNRETYKIQQHRNWGKKWLSTDFLSKLILGLVICLAALIFTKLYMSKVVDNTLLPFTGKSFPHDPILGDRFWSSLLSGHYFGLRAASPNSPIISMMWFRNRIVNNALHFRHWCSRDDSLDKFIWDYNDLNFGHQTILDDNLQINTSFIRNSGILQARINAIDTSKVPQFNSIILYSAIDDNQDSIDVINAHSFNKDPDFSIRTQSNTSGNYTLRFKVIEGKPVARGFLQANSTLDQLQETILQNLFFFKDAQSSKSIFMISNPGQAVSNYKNNFISYQIVFQNSINIDIEMIFDDAHRKPEVNYEQKLTQLMAQFDEKFEERFPLKKQNFSLELITFARSVLSNMIGGISYFYGTSLVKSTKSSFGQPYGPVQLLTAVPSRSFFPRGFLWDEGFHQLLISVWDAQLSKKIIKSWFDLLNKDGWIPREIILGDEAKARVPPEFLTQYSTTANPPTFFLSVESLIDNGQADNQWLRDIFPRFRAFYNWFNTTQSGKFPTTFRWRGRNETSSLELNPKTLASGLDDFPRATHPSDDEIHLDLRCWMALASRVMAKISKVLALDEGSFDNFYQKLRDNKLLEQLHWSDEHKMFCDKGLNSNDVQMVIEKRNGINITVRRVNRTPTYECVAHFGYISLFPLMTRLLEPDNPKLDIMLKYIENPNHLWSPYGLRSISKSDFYYEKFNTATDPPYWRGTIWMNMNYMTLRGLYHYANTLGPYQAHAKSVYDRLRNILIRAVFNEYQRSGYLWEQYSDRTGAGVGIYPFTGWSALIVQIMGERF